LADFISVEVQKEKKKKKPAQRRTELRTFQIINQENTQTPLHYTYPSLEGTIIYLIQLPYPKR